MLDLAFQELHILGSCITFVLICQCEHFIGHVQTVGSASRTNTLGRKEDIDAATGSEIKHNFARIELGQGSWISATERRKQRIFRNLSRLGRIVKIGRNRITTEAARSCGPAATTPSAFHSQSCLSIVLLYQFLYVCAHLILHLFADLNDILWLERLISGAAFRIQELQQFLQRFRIGCVMQEGALAPRLDQAFVFELVQVM